MTIDIQMVDALPAIRLDDRLVAMFTDGTGVMIGAVQSDIPLKLQAQGVQVADVIRIDYAGDGWTVVDVLESLHPGLYHCTRT